MAAKIDPKVAKEKRAKKIAIGGGILLLLLLAYEGPKTMKALNPPAPKTAAAESAPASSSTTTTGASAAAATTSAAPVPVNAALTVELAPAPKVGQLSVLTTSFKSKDPFRQLIKDETATPAAAPAAASPPAATPASAAAPKAPPASLKVVPEPAPDTGRRRLPGRLPVRRSSRCACLSSRRRSP